MPSPARARVALSILVFPLLFAAGCGRFDQDDRRADAGPRSLAAQVEDRAGEAGPPAAPTARARAFAALPDRGDLVGYPSTPVVRVAGPHAWHKAEVSEAHALRAIAGGTLHFTTPDGRALAYEYERHVEHPSGDWTWVGRLAGSAPGVQAILTFGADAVFGSLGQSDGPELRLTTREAASWIVAPAPGLAASGAPRSGSRPDFLLPPAAPRASGAAPARAQAAIAVPSTASATATAAATTTVDVLVGYTPGFAAALGGNSQATTRINFLVDVANAAYVNSGIDAAVRLVHAMQVSYPDATDNAQALEKMTGYDGASNQYTTPDPAFTALRNARETYGADLVSLVRKFNDPENEGCGIAWLIGGGLNAISPGYEYFGYSVVSDGVDGGFYCTDETFVHELGHNMGSAHDVDTAKGDDGVLDNPDDYGRYTYSFGYRTGLANGDFYTVMAYPVDRDSGPQQKSYRIFSTPAKTFCGGFACGTASADNARSLRQTVGIIATFRDTVVPDQATGARNDIGGDGRSDLMWFKWGAFRGWNMQGYTIASMVDYTPASDLFPYVTGQFNTRSGTDIAWRDGAGKLVFWVDGAAGYQRSAREYPMSFGWRLQASGDRNGDGTSDLVWRSAVDGRVMYWHMGPAQERLSYRAFTQLPAFDIVTTGDFNGDGNLDLFFRRRSDGATVIWLAQGVGYATSSPGSISKYWVPVNSGDFDGDGDDDVVWRSQIDGRVMIWRMQNGLRASFAVFDSDTTRELLGSGDFNGDGLLDLVWRRNDGAVSTWLNERGTFSNRYVGTIDTSWKYVTGGR